jgi:hypothetical protein
MTTLTSPVRVTFVLLLGCLLARPLLAEDFYVTRGQAEEYLLINQVDPETSNRDEKLLLARDKILEHTLLAMSWDATGRDLNEAQIQSLYAQHRELAIRMTREAWQVPAPVSQEELYDYAELARHLYYASHILVDEEALADSLCQRILAGDDFGQLATLFSQDPGSAEMGGQLGVVTAGQTVQEFERVLFFLEPGTVSTPVETAFGWHLIRLDQIELRDREYEESDYQTYREILERHARHDAEVAARDSLWQTHSIRVYRDRCLAGDIPGVEVVAQSRDTIMTRAEMERMMAEAFGDRLEMMGDNLAWEFVRYWIEQEAWHHEALASGFYESNDVLDRMDLRERLMKSSLLVSEVLPQGLEWSEQDLEHYLQGHESRFLAERSIDVLVLTFPSRSRATAARLRLLAGADVDFIADSLSGSAERKHLTAAEARGLPAEMQSELVELDPGRVSDVIDVGRQEASGRWKLLQLVGRSMPLLEESLELRQAVEQALMQELLDAEIARIVNEGRRITAWNQVLWLD